MMLSRSSLSGKLALVKLLCTKRSMSSSTLSMFPEYAQAKSNFNEGRFQRAIADYQRIFEIVQGLNSAQCNPMLLEVTDQLVQSYLYAGQVEKAFLSIQAASQYSSVTDHERVVLELLRSKTYQWKGDRANSLNSAQKATNTLESLDQDGDIRLFSDVYGQLGIANLLHGDIDEAEGYLQMAARWAQTPTQQLRSAANYGSVQWFRAVHADPSFSLWTQQMNMLRMTPKEFFQRFIQAPDAKKLNDQLKNDSSVFVTSSSSSKPSSSDTPKVTKAWVHDEQTMKMIQFALDIWQESVQEFVSGHSSATAAANTAAAMCGPMATGSDAMSMTGLSGDDIRTVPSTSPSPDHSRPSETVPLETLLQQDTGVAIAYAHLLTNIAEAQDVLAQSSEASHTLSSALKALQPVSHLPVTQPAIGRILKWVAYHHARASQNVSAEGLFRAAWDKLSAPTLTGAVAAAPQGDKHALSAFAHHDARYQYEAVLTRGLYAQVLCHWERREEQGLGMQKEVVETLLPMVVSTENDGQVIPRMPPQLIYPC